MWQATIAQNSGQELAAFAESFAGVPFLRNRAMQDIASRDGIVTAARMDGPDHTEVHARANVNRGRPIHRLRDGAGAAGRP